MVIHGVRGDGTKIRKKTTPWLHNGPAYERDVEACRAREQDRNHAEWERGDSAPGVTTARTATGYRMTLPDGGWLDFAFVWRDEA